MRTYFARAGRPPVDTVTFAQSVLGLLKKSYLEQEARLGFLPTEAYKILDTTLPRPTEIADDPVQAYVNNGEWKAKCECGGCEFVDLELLIFMCCSCWNKEHSNKWRPVKAPVADEREKIETVLLKRRRRIDRAFHPENGETIENLQFENEVMQVDVE